MAEAKTTKAAPPADDNDDEKVEDTKTSTTPEPEPAKVPGTDVTNTEITETVPPNAPFGNPQTEATAEEMPAEAKIAPPIHQLAPNSGQTAVEPIQRLPEAKRRDSVFEEGTESDVVKSSLERNKREADAIMGKTEDKATTLTPE